jgi:hypothetical protein
MQGPLGPLSMQWGKERGPCLTVYGRSTTVEQSRAARSHIKRRGSAHHCSEVVHLWYKQGILCTGTCGALDL